MVVLSASVCTRQGKALVSRQFVEMNRLRVEGLLAAFPKLLGGGMGQQQQHTYVETDSVRYVYQSLEKNQIYLLLVTTKASNIVEDLGTLRLLAKVVPDVAGGLQEGAIQDAAFDLIFAFDEVLTAGGYKEEAVTLASIRTNLIMDSHEEKIANALQESKEAEATKRMREEADKIRNLKLQQGKNALFQGGSGGGMGVTGGMEGFGGGGGGPGGGGFDPYNQQQQNDPYGNQNDPYSPYGQPAAPAAPEPPKVLAKTGMKLGGNKAAGGKSNSLMAAMAAEDNLFGGLGGGAAAGGGATSAFGGLAAPAPKPAAAPSTPLSLTMEEKVTVQMSREGSVEGAEVKGTLTLTANTDAGTAAIVTVNKAALPAAFNYATHPKVDKKTYESSGVLQLKGGKSFPVGRPIGILRWSHQGDDAAPLSINCWPEDAGNGTITVSIELELTNTAVTLQDVNILLPLGTTDPPAIESIDGIYKHDPSNGLLCWHFDSVSASENASASLEFSIAGSDTDAFFPVQVGFRSETLLCPVQLTSVTHSQNGTSIPHQLTQSFSPDQYQCA